MLSLWQDLRFAARVLRTNPGFTAVAVVALALGVGANTAIFSVVNGVLLRPQPYDEPERLVTLWFTPAGGREEGLASFKDIADWRAQTRSFEEVAAFRHTSYTLNGVGEPQRVEALRVSSGFFDVLRVRPAAGRAFRPEEDAPGGEPVAVVSHEFWQNSLGRDAGVLGRRLLLDARPHTVVGVLPRGFRTPLDDGAAAVYTTVAGEGANLASRGARVARVVARLKPGVTAEQARADLDAVARALARQYPDTNADTTAHLVGLHEQHVAKVRPALFVLLVAVGLVLLIACSNVANLLLGRAASRRKEMAIRAALGAGRWRVVRQLLTESVLLAVLAGAGGLLLALWSIDALVALGPADLPRLGEIRADARVFGFALLLSVLTGVLFGLAPALRASRPDLNDTLREGGRGSAAGGGRRLRGLLIVSQTALALMLLVCAGLLLKSFVRLLGVNPGFEAENVLTLRVNLPRERYRESAPRVEFVRQALEGVRGVPGVEGAAFVGPMPFSHSEVFGDFRIVGRPEPRPGEEPGAAVRSVTPDYFRVMRIPLRRGRHFDERDRKGVAGAAVINETMARDYWPGQDPLGQRVRGIGANQNGDEPPEWEIVGVVGDVRHDGLDSEPKPELYLPHQQNSWSWGVFVVRLSGAPTALAGRRVRDEIMAVDRDQPVVDVKPLAQLVSESVAQPRFYALLVGAFSAVGLTLAVLGIYSVISYAVTERTHEIGVRMALGASPGDVRRLMLRHGMTYALAGIAAGTAGALAAARYMSSQLFGVTATDASVFASGPLLVAAVALLACYVPARRATKVDPMEALRYE